MTICRRCGNRIEEDEFDNNDGYCDDCAFDIEGGDIDEDNPTEL